MKDQELEKLIELQELDDNDSSFVVIEEEYLKPLFEENGIDDFGTEIVLSKDLFNQFNYTFDIK